MLVEKINHNKNKIVILRAIKVISDKSRINSAPKIRKIYTGSCYSVLIYDSHGEVWKVE